MDMAIGYGLLQLPKMPEFKNVDTTTFPTIPNLDINTIPYKDKQREVVRQKKLEEYQKSGQWPGKKVAPKKQTEAWSKAKQNKVERQEKRAKRKAKKALVDKNLTPKTKKRKKGISEEDLKELANDIALLKKLKKKKISEEQFDQEMGLS